MFLTRDCEMGIRAVLHLAVHGGSDGMTVDEIAQAQHLSPSYLSRVFQYMVKAGVLAQHEAGRYRLERPPGDITIRALVESFSIPLALTRCLVHHDKIHPCGEEGTCELFAMWQDLSHSILKALECRTLGDMINVAPKEPADSNVKNPAHC